MNSSGALVIPYKGLYALNFTVNCSGNSGTEQISFLWSGTGSGDRLGAVNAGGGAVVACTYIGPFAAGDVLTPTFYTNAAFSVGPSSPPSIYNTLSICLLQRM